MDNSKLTSFIPKNSSTMSGPAGMGASIPKASRFAGAYNFLGVLSFAVLALALIFTAGAFVYRLFVFNQIYSPCNADGRCGLADSLKRDRENLGVDTLIRAKRLEVKTSRGQELLGRHVSVAPVFRDILNTLTLQGISYSQLEMGDKGIIISGMAKSYEDIAYQAKVFAGNDAKGKIKSFNFYDLDLDQKGNVTFKLDLVPDSSILSFSKTALQ